MSDGISDGFPFSHEEKELTKEEWRRLLRAHYLSGLQKDRAIAELRENLDCSETQGGQCGHCLKCVESQLRWYVQKYEEAQAKERE